MIWVVALLLRSLEGLCCNTMAFIWIKWNICLLGPETQNKCPLFCWRLQEITETCQAKQPLHLSVKTNLILQNTLFDVIYTSCQVHCSVCAIHLSQLQCFTLIALSVVAHQSILSWNYFIKNQYLYSVLKINCILHLWSTRLIGKLCSFVIICLWLFSGTKATCYTISAGQIRQTKHC